ncbi:MAG: ABC transporter permease subunit [Pseudomonadales bacterium]
MTAPATQTYTQLIVARFLRNRTAFASLAVLSVIMLLAVVGPSTSPWEYDEIDWDHIAASPGSGEQHWFGTDNVGRDLYVRTFAGARVSLSVALLATAVSVLIGVPFGAIAGYVGGRTDLLMMRFVDVLYSLPFMFFVILLVVVFGRNIVLIFIALGAVSWLDLARIVRGQTLSIKEQPFIEAAVALGVPSHRVVLRHVIPNLLGPVAIYGTLTIPGVILAESFISFLGLGVQEPGTSWGVLIAEGTQEMETAPWMLIFPASFLATSLFCFNYVGDGLRDAFDPRMDLR